MKYLVSACLAGSNCRYDGNNNLYPEIKKLVDEGKALPFCPEKEGGLSTPRTPCEIQNDIEGNRIVISKDGVDCTDQFYTGAKKALNICKKHNITNAILKAKSPSCGNKQIYNGSFCGVLINASGICSELLTQNDITVLEETEYLNSIRK